jgi:hypothetical protein
MAYNYAALKKIRKPTIVATEHELPRGDWVPLSVAAKKVNRHTHTLRMRFLKGKIEGYKIGEKGCLLVNLEGL